MHTLVDAVLDGTITADAAFCGLSSKDIEHLKADADHAKALVLIRLRTRYADGRTIMSIEDLARWLCEDYVLAADGMEWEKRDIRDIFPVKIESEPERCAKEENESRRFGIITGR